MGNDAMVGRSDEAHNAEAHNAVDDDFARTFLTSFRQCRTALLRSATMASGARIPPIATRARFGAHPSQHFSLLQDYRPAVDLHTVGCELHGFSRRRVLRTTRRNEPAFTRA
jgi:hypothetical protein